MKIVNITIGSAEWLATFSASKAPTMMGANPYQSRNDLLRVMANGIADEVDAATQVRYDAGHAVEAATRPLIENKLGKLLPAVTATDDRDYLLASFDGLVGTTGWECKFWNEKIVDQIQAKELDPFYYWQLEQQILVGGLKRVIFTCSDGTPEKCVSMEYRPVAGRAAQLLAGWKQFEADLTEYQPVEVLPAAVAAPTMQLPALSIQVKGEISLIDNLALFGEKLTAFISAIDKNPSTDQAFADAEGAIKTLETAQAALEAAEAGALAQTASIDEMRRTVALYAGQARQTRLMLTGLVKVRKESIRVEIVQKGRADFAAFIARLNVQLGKAYMPSVPENFAGVIKGKKTVASLHDAVDTELARVKIEANDIAGRISINLNTLRELAADHAFLFADTAQIVLKANDDLTALVKTRIAEHAAAEAKRLEDDRIRIRAEEAAKLQREQQAKETAAQPPTSIAQGHPAQPAAAAPIKPVVTLKASGKVIPSDTAIIHAVAVAFQTDDATALEWLCAMFAKQAA